MAEELEQRTSGRRNEAGQPESFWAHSLADPKTGEVLPEEEWEPLFTPFGEKLDPADPEAACTGEHGAPCLHCESMAAKHGHLNKVAWWAGNFAAEMVLETIDQ